MSHEKESLWGKEITELEPIHYRNHDEDTADILKTLHRMEQKCDINRAADIAQDARLMKLETEAEINKKIRERILSFKVLLLATCGVIAVFWNVFMAVYKLFSK